MADGRKKVLIVEDEQDLLTLYAMTLSKEGYAVDTTANGQEAIAKTKKDAPDILVLDIMIPSIDGYHVAYEISRDQTLPKKPKILFITARNISQETRLIEFAGANGVLQKPFSNDDLKRAVKSLLE